MIKMRTVMVALASPTVAFSWALAAFFASEAGFSIALPVFGLPMCGFYIPLGMGAAALGKRTLAHNSLARTRIVTLGLLIAGWVIAWALLPLWTLAAVFCTTLFFGSLSPEVPVNALPIDLEATYFAVLGIGFPIFSVGVFASAVIILWAIVPEKIKTSTSYPS